MAKLITPRKEDYARWYTDVVTQAKLADYSPVKGCMVIRPHGYALWENMQSALNRMFKETGHKNAYFPLFIPKSFLAKEAEHVEGFAKECAIVTHSRLKVVEVDAMFAKWVQSYRDLPLLINQWANIVRWEMRTRLFLRTTEFLWQEGHTAHATEAEAEEEARRMLEVYRTFAEEHAAIPVITGVKTEREKFAGADRTYTIEALMQDNRALQAGTSHQLGQNFAKVFDLKYQDEAGVWQHAWNTSWGMTTRMVGAAVMVHGDDNGLVLPPRLSPVHVVIVPIWKGKDPKDEILAAARTARDRLIATGLSVELDDRDNLSPGFKFNEWEMMGVPLRLELGPKDLQKGSVMSVKRPNRAKAPVPVDALEDRVRELLDEIQREMFETARARRDAATFVVDTWDEFNEKLASPGGFILAHWCGGAECERTVQEETKATIRCLAFDQPAEKGRCIRCDGESARRVHFARAY
jgi:prolyl-tRNA synthetase